jgi:hypothetical protein
MRRYCFAFFDEYYASIAISGIERFDRGDRAISFHAVAIVEQRA